MSNTKHILFNFASRSRPDRMLSVISNITRLCDNDNHTINLKLDNDDHSVQHPYVQQVLSITGKVVIQWGTSTGKINAINRNVPAEGWDILVDVGDDFVFTRQGFDNVIREHCGPDDFLLFPEPYAKSQAQKGRNEMIVIMMCMGYQYYQRDKSIFNPAFKSLFCDNFATNLAKIRGRLKFVNEEIFYHAHPAAGYGKKDAQLQHTESFWNEDKIMYKNLMRRINEFK